MKKLLAYILPLILSYFALIPPIEFRIPAPTEHWPLMIMCAGFAGFYTLFLRTNFVVKAIAVLSFINCFLSVAPYISFNAYVSVVVCCYFYILYSHVEDWRPTFTALKVLLILNAVLVFMQWTGHDALLNFGLEHNTCFGVVGQHMQMGSFSVILAAALLPAGPWVLIFPVVMAFYCQSAWTLFCAAIGALFFLARYPRASKIVAGVLLAAFLSMAALTGKFEANLHKSNGRALVWTRTIELANQRPLTGWGIGTYKAVFPGLSEIRSVPWMTAHNCWLQLLFELGRPLFFFFVMCFFAFLVLPIWWVIKRPETACVAAGLAMISLDMFVHFPTRMIQCVPVMIAVLAYCSRFLCAQDCAQRR